MKVKFQIALTLFLTLNVVSKCKAAPAKWAIADGGNDHSYLAIATEKPISWADANEMANKLGGHLVTLTSAAENDFIFHLIDSEMYWYPGINLRGPWTGGYQLPGSSEPTGGWSWVTGEPFTYEFWEAGQPNNFGGQNEDRIHFGNRRSRVQTWNDVVFNFAEVKSYVVEFSEPDLAPVKWFVRDGGNGYSYLAVAAPGGITWAEANRIARSVDGYLATITSPEENDFITKLVNNDVYWSEFGENAIAGPWIGGYQLLGSSEPSDGWRWITNEPLTYTNWGQGMPDNSSEVSSNKNCLHLFQLTSKGNSKTVWDDLPEDYPGIHGYVIEFPPGQPMPAFEGINIDFDPSKAKDKRILICFLDMNQRPSRYCVQELAKRMEDLKGKGIIVVLVHISKGVGNALDEWIKKNNIPFSVGVIQGDVEKVRSNWGFESLPWLILTNNQHLVIDAGFGLNELDGKIEATN